MTEQQWQEQIMATLIIVGETIMAASKGGVRASALMAAIWPLLLSAKAVADRIPTDDDEDDGDDGGEDLDKLLSEYDRKRT